MPRFNAIKYGQHSFLWSKLTKKERDMNILNAFE